MSLLYMVLLLQPGCFKKAQTRAALETAKVQSEEACSAARYNRDVTLAALEEAAKAALETVETRRGERSRGGAGAPIRRRLGGL